jgi:transposase
MRGTDTKQASMMCLVSPESAIPEKHPLRKVKVIVAEALKSLSPIFDDMYSRVGRPSIPPERLLKASLLMAFYTIRSERLFCEQLGYNLLFRWFLDMDMTESTFDHSTFTKNRTRLMEFDVAGEFFRTIVERAQEAGLMSDDHFSVDGTLIEAWASLKSFQPKAASEDTKDKGDDDQTPPRGDSNRWVNFHGEKRSNETHESKTDPEAKLMRKGPGKEAKLSFSAHALMENRNGLLVDMRVAEANGTAEREVAVQMMGETVIDGRRITVGADKGYDTRGFVAECREMHVTPHVAQNTGRLGGSAIDAKTTRHPGYAVSQRIRKKIEEIFGWIKTVGNFRRTRYKGTAKTQLAAYFVGSAFNLIRIAKLTAAAA